MKKITAIIIGCIIITVSVIIFQKDTYSTTGVTYAKPNSCLQATVNEMDLMRISWNQNLSDLIEQEKAASEIVDEAFESMRTYRCWLNYLCEMVLVSGNASEKLMKSAKVSMLDINIISGCIAPEKVDITKTKLQYIPQCNHLKLTGEGSTASKSYSTCRKLVSLEFAEPASTDGESTESAKFIENFKNGSSAYVGLERLLKAISGTKKNTVLQNKLKSILTGMHGMEKHMTYLRKYMETFDQRLTCQIAK